MKNYLDEFEESPDNKKETTVRVGGSSPLDYYERTREMEQERRRREMQMWTSRTPGLIVSRPSMVEYGPVYPVPRNDGKRVCSKLRKAREELARANFIPFVAVPCRQEEACGGSCPTCDAEVEYLERELAKIPEYRRVYPTLDIEEEK